MVEVSDASNEVPKVPPQNTEGVPKLPHETLDGLSKVLQKTIDETPTVHQQTIDVPKLTQLKADEISKSSQNNIEDVPKPPNEIIKEVPKLPHETLDGLSKVLQKTVDELPKGQMQKEDYDFETTQKKSIELDTRKTYGLAIASIVIGFITVIISFKDAAPLLVFAVIGLILGIISFVNISKSTELKGKGLAVAGIILSSVSIILFIILLGK